MANRYWVGGTGTWSETAHWSTSSGGVGGASVPGVNDNVYFDVNSFSADGQTVSRTASGDSLCSIMDWSGITYNVNLYAPNTTYKFAPYSSITLSSKLTMTGTPVITPAANSDNRTLRTNGCILYMLRLSNSSNAYKVSLLDNLVCSENIITASNNKTSLDCNGFNVTANEIAWSVGTGTLYLRTGTITVRNLTYSAGTINAGTSTLIINGGTIDVSLMDELILYNVRLMANCTLAVTTQLTMNNLEIGLLAGTITCTGTILVNSITETVAGMYTLGHASNNWHIESANNITLRKCTTVSHSLASGGGTFINYGELDSCTGWVIGLDKTVETKYSINNLITGFTGTYSIYSIYSEITKNTLSHYSIYNVITKNILAHYRVTVYNEFNPLKPLSLLIAQELERIGETALINTITDVADNVVVIASYGGTPIQTFDDGLAVRNIDFQIKIRDTHYEAAYARALVILALFAKYINNTNAKTVTIQAKSDIIDIGQDERKRTSLTTNFRAKII